MISSVPREESDLALRALKSGASDYVEKPTLNNLAEQSDEIRGKLHMAVVVRNRGNHVSALDKAFATHVKVEKPETKVRIIVAGMSHVKDVNTILAQLSDDQAPTLILLDGSANLLDPFSKELKCGRYKCVGSVSSAAALGVNQVGVMHFKSSIDSVRKDLAGKHSVICVLGIPSKLIVDKILEWGGAGLILEDMDGKRSKNYRNLREVAQDVMPVPSMGYMSTKFLNNN
jgi:chemotaxis protein methyltransferase CheR